jgi:hypothetical protein
MATMISLIRLMIVGFLCLLVLPGWAESAPASAVGQVTLTIGSSQVVRAGQVSPLVRGSTIQVGDRIETSASGHVHIRFVDQARVSVRPNSVLVVQTYHFDPVDPTRNAVKFQLEQGVVRAISGEAAHQARDRFRLNTPLVAIGVRGTDFTTQAGPFGSAVVVNQGTIVLTPLGKGCSAMALGPCEGARARVLSASMGSMALVYRANMSEPSFQPLNSLKGTDHITPILQQEQQGAAETSEVVADSKAPGSVDSLLPQRSGLVWGRWQTTAVPGDDLTVPFLAALRGNQVTVGDGYYFLFRNTGVPQLLGGVTGVVQFGLQGGAASYRSPGNVYSAASLQGGTLGIDFTHDTFATTLSVNSSVTGLQTLSSAGSLNPTTGIFVNGAGSPHVAGAVSLDTLQAGYLFNKPLTNGGALLGATLWGR